MRKSISMVSARNASGSALSSHHSGVMSVLIETDPARRRKQFDDVQVILHDELPVIFLMEMAYTHLWNKRVHGLITNGISMYSNWDSVWVD